jgi:hypothetical protein
MQGSFWLKCAAAAILGLAATRATVARDVTPDEWWATRGPGPAAQSSSDDWWSAMDATLPPDVAVKKAAKARKRAPPPDTYPPPPSDWRPPPVPPPIPQWTGEFGGRYWFSLGSTELDLHGGDSFTPLVSRLTYTNIQAHSGEAFGRVEHLSGFFVKGFAGGGAITTGNLQDEDFPPFDPGGIYSSTNSDQRNGRLAYATIDTGWTWRGDTSKLGFFVGYNYFHELVNAFGCTQDAANPFICAPPVPASTLGITDEWNWNGIRLGFNGEWRFWGGFAFNLDFAWLPHVWLNGSDTHELRSFTAPESGSSSFSNVQLDALLRYQFINGLSLGVGVRYWKLNTNFGRIFDVGGVGLLQNISVNTERWGPLFQASYKFGELRPSRY